MSRNWRILCLGLLLAALLVGCKKKVVLPETLPELRDLAASARDDARAQREAKSPEESAAAADLAEAAAQKAQELFAQIAEPAEADRQAKQDTLLAARQARRLARLADEDQKLGEYLNGWKARAYRGARGLAVPGAFKGLALAADQAGKTDPEKLPAEVRHTAKEGAGLAQQLAGREPLPDGSPDWPAVAADLRLLADQPPPEMNQFVALALLVAGKHRYALYEIELVDAVKLPPPSRKNQRLLRAVILSMNDLPNLGVEEVERLPAEDRGGDGPELLAGIHLLIAYLYLETKDYESADREVVRAMQIWPNNPVGVFLTGEILAANGDTEKAAQSLESLAQGKGEDTEWLAARVAQRARELRDRPGEGQTLIHDRGFVVELMLHYLANSARKSAPAQRLQQSVNSAKAFGTKLLDQMPSLGKGEEPAP